MSICSTPLYPYESRFKRIYITYIGELIIHSEKYYQYQIKYFNHRYPHSMRVKSPLHPYLIPGTVFIGYYDQNFNVFQVQEDFQNLYSSLQIISQKSSQTIKFKEDIYVLKKHSYLVYDILNDMFYQTERLDALRIWDIYYSATAQVPDGVSLEKLMPNQKRKLKIKAIKFTPGL